MKVAVVILAGTETHEGLGRIVNGLEAAKESKEADDDVTIIFDGAGVQGLADISSTEHKAHALFADVQDRLHGACAYCARAFGVSRRLEQADMPLLNEFDEHPSLRRLLKEGYQVLTF